MHTSILYFANQDETAAHDCHSTGNFAIRMRKVLPAKPRTISFPEAAIPLVSTTSHRWPKRAGSGDEIKPRKYVVRPLLFKRFAVKALLSPRGIF